LSVLEIEASLKYPAQATCLPHRPQVVSSMFKSISSEVAQRSISGMAMRVSSKRERYGSDQAAR
jgi:hypothetical protein